MDPINPGPEDHGQAPSRRPPREPLTADFGPGAPAPARTVRLVSGDFLLTVNPVDGSEIEPCPPGEQPGRPRKLTAAERAEHERAARPPVPPGPAQPALSLLERQDERERLVRLLARGRSVRLTGPAGSGRTALLDLVAEDCLDLAPDGVVRLSGFRRTATELLYDLCHAVYDAPLHRPGRDELLALVREIGAVVVVDDTETGGAALDELLDATPECAFLFGATPDVPAPSADAEVEEVFLTGLDRAGGVEILERAVGRVLTEEEANWAGDLWFESEGLPLRFVQAGALLRQRDQLRASTGAVDEYGVFEDVRHPDGSHPDDEPLEPAGDEEVPLPSLGEAAAPAPLLASRLSGSARATLRFAVALGGEVPHQAHLPALIGDTHADAALGELAACGLVSPVGPRYRLAAGVQTQLEAVGYGDDAPAQALAAAQHYAWWTGHPSVTPERVCAEADAVLAALAVVVPDTAPPAEDEESTAVRLARTAAPAFAAGLHWGAWERALRSGTEASRLAGEVPEQAYFHHELGVLALCGGQLDRARAELEASIGLRGALADKRGTVAGRRALALVADRAGDTPGPLAFLAAEETSEAHPEESALTSSIHRTGTAASPSHGTPPAHGSRPGIPSSYGPLYADPLIATQQLPAPQSGGTLRRLARRNLVAAGSGALLAVVLGTVVTLGMTSHDSDNNPADKVNTNPTAAENPPTGDLDADPGATGGPPKASATPTNPAGTASDSARPPGDDTPPAAPGTPGSGSKSPKPRTSGTTQDGTSGGTTSGGTDGTDGGTTGGSTGTDGGTGDSGGSGAGGTGDSGGDTGSSGGSGTPSGSPSGTPSGTVSPSASASTTASRSASSAPAAASSSALAPTESAPVL